VKENATDFVNDFNQFIGDMSLDHVMFKSWVDTMIPIPELDLKNTLKAMEIAGKSYYGGGGGGGEC